MGLMQLIECDGCQARTAAQASILTVPAGWRLFGVTRMPAYAIRDGNPAVTLCGECQASPEAVRRILAEVLGW